MPNFRNTMLASAAAAALALGFGSGASATSVTIDPGAPNTGNGSGGAFALNGVNVNNPITGGLGTAYTDLFTGTNTSVTGAYGFDAVVNLTSITGGNIGLGSSYQIFALISVSGTGTWSSTPQNGISPGFVSGATGTVNVQIYGVHGTGNSFAAATANDSSTLPPVNITPGQSVSHTVLTGTNFPDFDGATSNLSHVGSRTCWDGTAIGGSSNCILLADGTATTFSIKAGGQSTTTNADTEEFILSTILSPESYAAGSTGFFGADGNVTLTVNSGGTPTEAFEAVSDNTCFSTPIVCQLEGSPGVSWAVSESVASVPEPASLSLFGAALIGVSALLRRKRKSA